MPPGPYHDATTAWKTVATGAGTIVPGPPLPASRSAQAHRAERLRPVAGEEAAVAVGAGARDGDPAPADARA